MKFVYDYYSDVGIEKQINEDSLLIKCANSTKGRIILALVCDGMGGLSSGEVASATVIKFFSNWFDNDLQVFLKDKQFTLNSLQNVINSVLKELNQRILSYGYQNRINLGTTATGIIILNNQYFIFHVGDTRAYQINDEITQITEDQTWINEVVKNKVISEEEANKDPRKNALLQCIGASKTVIPAFYYGETKFGDIYLICSDGFRHMISNKELFDQFNSSFLVTKEYIKEKLFDFVELNKKRNETDNITALLLQCYREE